ncbi:MAG TPA: hypothetical protein VN581_00470 [Patescibacteria group bacterium]|nr:hypothetical protein [Patescibacteria group bacterium]
MNSHRNSDLRARLAQEAARIMAEQGVRDFGAAKRKAAERLGIRDERDLPANRDIEAALRDYQRLFQSATQPRRLRRLREIAVEAMAFFSRFEPRLVGAVLEGTADEHSAVCLHLFDDDPSEVLRFLEDQQIPCDEDERVLRLTREHSAEFPSLRFDADDHAIDLTVLPRIHLRQAPLSRTSDAPMQRASINAVRALLANEKGG